MVDEGDHIESPKQDAKTQRMRLVAACYRAGAVTALRSATGFSVPRPSVFQVFQYPAEARVKTEQASTIPRTWSPHCF
jgi:hypothetical protein